MNMYLTLQNPTTRIQNALKIGWSAILFIALWLGISLSVWAQPQYDFTAASGTFTPLTGGTTAGIDADDAISATLPIGFSFTYDGVAYTQIKASSNGWMTFNTGATAHTTTNDLDFSSTTIRPLLAPLWDDLDGGFGGAPAPAATYTTEGVAGSQIFTMEWLNWGWDWQANVPVMSFQVKLYEATGVIEYIYQQEAGAINNGGASIGLTTSTTGINSFISLSDASAAPTASSTTETTNINTKPATGQIYRWSPKLFDLSPVDNATAIALNTNLTVTFLSGTPAIGTGNIEIKKTSDNSVVETIILPSAQVTVAGQVVTINPSVILDCNTEYYVNVPASAITGVPAFVGITNMIDWSFTTTAPVPIVTPTGAPAVEYTSTPSAGISSTNPTTISTQTIGTIEFVSDLKVFVDITHTFMGDVDMFLTHVTSGITVELSTDNGGGGDNMVTTFDDAAATAITTGTAPFTGIFRPEGLLSAFNGQRLDGDWTLTITDDAGGDDGTLNSWKIIHAPTSAELPLTATFTPTNGATNVAANSNLVLNFDFPVSAGTGNIEIVNTATNAVLETIPVASARVNYGTVGQVTINPTNDFPSAAVIAVRFPTGAFQSCNSIDVVGITNTTDWRFTVFLDPCATLTINAGANQTGVAFDSNVTLAGVAATGGSGTYTYAWTPAANFNDPTILNPVVSNVITSTTYTLTVTDTGTGCTKFDDIFVSVTAPTGGGGGGNAPTVVAPSLRITSVNTTSLRLNWTGGSSENYVIFRSLSSRGNYTRLGQVAGTVSTYLDSMLMPDTRYYYYVQAIRGSAFANSGTVSDFTYPSAPTVASFQNACVGTGAQLTVRGSSGLYKVYSAATGGTAVVTGDSTGVITTPTFADSTTFYLSAVGVRYESTPRVAVSVITRELPTATMLGASLQESCTDSLTIMAEAVDGATYTWYSANIPVATTNEPTYTTNRNGVYSVLVNKEGCVARSNTVSVRVNRISPAQIRGLATREFCETGIIQAVQTEGASYEWQNNNAVVGTGSDLEVTQSGTYTVTVTSILGCVLTSTSVSVTVINVPQLDLQSSASDFCEGTEGVELTVNSVNGATYEWLRNGSRVRTTSTPSLQVNVGAEYRVRVILNGNCSRTSDLVTVTRNAAPAASVRVYGDSIKVVYVGNVALTSVTWTKDDAPFSATTQAFVPTESGLYTATVTYETGCQVVASGIQYIKPPETPVIVGEEEVEALGFMLFPNPTASKVNLAFGDAFKGEITLTLTDAIGRTIQVVKVKATENATIDLSSVANGSYMLTIASEDKVVTRKIIRE